MAIERPVKLAGMFTFDFLDSIGIDSATHISENGIRLQKESWCDGNSSDWLNQSWSDGSAGKWGLIFIVKHLI